MEINEFNFFIQEMKIEDIPMVGRRFTWYKSNSHCKSRLDRCLVSKSWLMRALDTMKLAIMMETTIGHLG